MLHFFGFIMLILGVVMLVPVPVTFIFDEVHLLPYFVVPAAIAIALGLFLRKRFKPKEISLGNAMVVVTFIWILFSAFCSVPYVLGNQMRVEDAYFESMSGLTATGLTMMGGRIEDAPRTILFWRSLTVWVGGLGVVVLFLAALVGFGRAARKMYVAEARAGFIEPTIRATARSLLKVYVVLTVVAIIGLLAVGMKPFESVNHAMAGIATGGFSVNNDSFMRYGYAVWAVTIVIMVAGATSFVVHRRVLAGRWRELFANVEVRLMLTLITVSTILLIWSFGFRGLGHSLFQSTSAISGTGFYTADLSGWTDIQKGVLTWLMVIGGGYGSTSSALKLIRIIVIAKAVHWMIRRSFLPERAVVPMKVAGREYTERDAMETAIYAFLYLVVLAVGGSCSDDARQSYHRLCVRIDLGPGKCWVVSWDNRSSYAVDRENLPHDSNVDRTPRDNPGDSLPELYFG